MNLARPSTRATATAIVTGAALLAAAPAAAPAVAPAVAPHVAPDVAPAVAGRAAAARYTAASGTARAPGDPTGPVLQTIPLVSTAGRPEATTGAAAQTGAARATGPFSLIGATWTNPHAALGGTVEVRTRSAADGRWTGWRALESDGPNGADPAGGTPRGSTDPLWVGGSDGVEARVTGSGGRTGRLPAGLRLDLINPATAAAATPAGPSRAESAPAPRAAGVVFPARPVPRVITRAGWGADETIVQHAPDYTTDVQVMFVHHTATGNGYACSQSAAIVRGIELYHVRSRGWNDVGYNFLVDKCGNLFEGRRGGVDQPVLGAHTLGFNSHSSAIAVIGTYTSTAVPTVVQNVVARVAAYKVGAYGNNPNGRVVVTSAGSDRYPAGTRVTLNRISGHRDTGRTECPGDALYAQLPGIRALAGAGPAGLRLTQLAGTSRVGSAYYTRGPVRPIWSLSTPSTMLNRFDVLVDGAVAAAGTNGSRALLVRLTPGAHTVAVRAVHLSGRTATASARVIADVTPPVFTTRPQILLRPGSLARSVPVRLYWSVRDAGALRTVALIRPALVDLRVPGPPWPTVATPGVAGTWTIRAGDWAGNSTDASVTRTPAVVSEAAAARTGHWRTLTNPGYLGGQTMFSTAPGATMTYTFTGRGLALAVTSNRGTGRVRIYLDGIDKGYVDTRGPTTANRTAVWAGNWSASGTHTAKFVVEGTSGRPAVIMDGIVVLR